MYQRVLNYQEGVPMRYEELSSEEQEIIRRYRQVPESQKKAILASEHSFEQWLKKAVRWVWEKIIEVAAHEVIKMIWETLASRFFGH
jgi:hypothetical protein